MSYTIEALPTPIAGETDETAQATLHQLLAEQLNGLLEQRRATPEELPKPPEKRHYGSLIGRSIGVIAAGGGAYFEAMGKFRLGTALLVIDVLFVAGPLNEARGKHKDRRHPPQL